MLEIYTDGSCLGNGNEYAAGGYAAVFMKDGEVVSEIGGSTPSSTNFTMELTAALAALRHLIVILGDDEVATIYADSEYVVKGITKWIHNWKKNGYRGSTGKPVKNQDLWRQLDVLTRRHGNVHWEHVEGHKGVAGNERADEIANQYARLQKEIM